MSRSHDDRRAAGALPRRSVEAMTNARQRLGRAGEELVALALDGPTLVFVEVKARTLGSFSGPERPVLAVGHRKRHKLRSLALAWLRDRDGSVPRHSTLRFDVVGVRLDAAGRMAEWEHLRGAF